MHTRLSCFTDLGCPYCFAKRDSKGEICQRCHMKTRMCDWYNGGKDVGWYTIDPEDTPPEVQELTIINANNRIPMGRGEGILMTNTTKFIQEAVAETIEEGEFIEELAIVLKPGDEGFHYKYGGSTAPRTLGCPGWAALAATLPKKGSSEAADRGSMLHLCCEILERDGLEEFQDLMALDVEYNGFKLTEELLDTKVIPAMEHLDSLCETYGVHTITTEEMFEIDEVTGGIIDITGEADKTLVIADYKFGEGVLVYAENNASLLFYAWIKVENAMRLEEDNQGKKIMFRRPVAEFKKVVLAIIQPADKREEPLDIWEVTMDDVLDFGERFLDAVDIAEGTKAGENLCTGSWCKFCPASKYGDCPKVVAEQNADLSVLKQLDSELVATDNFEVLDNFEVVGKKKVYDMATLDISTALKVAKRLESWTKAVRAFACEQMELGTEVEDWKLVAKRATRQWKDPEHTAKYLKRKLTAQHAMVSVPLSPAAAEKEGKRQKVKLRLKDLIETKSSGTTLAPADDPREAIISQKGIAETLKKLEEN